MTATGKLIGITGFAQHGKDSVGKLLVEKYGFIRFAFADALKSMALVLDPLVNSEEWGEHVRLSRMVDAEGWDVAKKDPEVRRFLQVLGTEGARETFGPDCWVDALTRAVNKLYQPGVKHDVVITDVRFHNEADLIHEEGGELWFVERENPDGTAFINGIGTEHPSERNIMELGLVFSDRHLIASDLEGLEREVERVMQLAYRS